MLDPLLARKLRQRIRVSAFDLIHAHHFEGTIVARMAARGFALPIVYDAHTTLALELPQCVIDIINPRKQGRFIPLTGHRVAGPEALIDYRPDLVLVMNPAYSAEIAQQLEALGVRARPLPV